MSPAAITALVFGGIWSLVTRVLAATLPADPTPSESQAFAGLAGTFALVSALLVVLLVVDSAVTASVRVRGSAARLAANALAASLHAIILWHAFAA